MINWTQPKASILISYGGECFVTFAEDLMTIEEIYFKSVDMTVYLLMMDDGPGGLEPA